MDLPSIKKQKEQDWTEEEKRNRARPERLCSTMAREIEGRYSKNEGHRRNRGIVEKSDMVVEEGETADDVNYSK